MLTDLKALADPNYCLDKEEQLRKKHKYYCQIQTQVYVTESNVWLWRGDIIWHDNK